MLSLKTYFSIYCNYAYDEKNIEARDQTHGTTVGTGAGWWTQEFFSSATVFMDEVLSLEHSAKPVDLIMFGHLAKTPA